MERHSNKKCPCCGRFMTLYWREAAPFGLEDRRVHFLCINSRCLSEGWDPEDLTLYYRFLIYEDPEYLEESRKEIGGVLTQEDYLALVAEREEMKRLFEARPYYAIPIL